MVFSDSVLKAYLSNVFWIGGGSCSGKTTITDMLAEKHGFVPYHAEEHTEHRGLVNVNDHPATSRKCTTEEWYLGAKGAEEHSRFVQALIDEQLEMVVLDAIRLSQDRPVVVDTSHSPHLLSRIASDGKLLCLYADEPTIRASFLARDDKKDWAEAIGTLSRPDEARENLFQRASLLAPRSRAQAEEAGLVCLDRADTASVEDMLAKVEAQFGL
jgi:dephospho-CoA kinase